MSRSDGCDQDCGSRGLKDPVIAKSSPSDSWPGLSIAVNDRRPLPCCAAIWTAKAPCQLKDARCVHHCLYPQIGWPTSRVSVLDKMIARRTKITSRFAKQLALVLGEPLIVAFEWLRYYKSHESRSASSESTSSNTVTRPLEIAWSASRSSACHRSVQNHVWSTGTAT